MEIWLSNGEAGGTTLKPAHEPIVLARKPFDTTVIVNIQEHGTGALNIDGCRIELTGNNDPRLGGNGTWNTDNMAKNTYGKYNGGESSSSPLGRFPANFMHDGSEEVVELFPQNKGQLAPINSGKKTKANCYGNYSERPSFDRYDAPGSCARFFYCAKASPTDRGEDNDHPTVKPTDLMRYLCRLITPPNGLVLDPFMGSGSTGKAALLERFRFVGIEMDSHYMDIAEKRIGDVVPGNVLEF